jgi:hypothetical protein
VRLPYRDVLRQREFRLFISARTVSQLGNYASITVIAFAVLATGAGAGGVGLVLGAESLAMTVLLLLGGALGVQSRKTLALRKLTHSGARPNHQSGARHAGTAQRTSAVCTSRARNDSITAPTACAHRTHMTAGDNVVRLVDAVVLPTF